MTDLAETAGIPVAHDHEARRSLLQRVRIIASGAGAALLGLLPHILHHAGPLAGAALFAGVGGSLLFGAVGLIAAVPFLVQMKRRCGSWRRPLATLALFAAVFLVSTFVVGPSLTGEDSSDGAESRPAPSDQPASPSGHEQHH